MGELEELIKKIKTCSKMSQEAVNRLCWLADHIAKYPEQAKTLCLHTKNFTGVERALFKYLGFEVCEINSPDLDERQKKLMFHAQGIHNGMGRERKDIPLRAVYVFNPDLFLQTQDEEFRSYHFEAQHYSESIDDKEEK